MILTCYTGGMAKPKLFVTVGQRFGNGVVIDPEIHTGPRLRTRGARLLCDCGNEYEVAMSNLFSGHTMSCGCLHREVMAQICHDRNETTHFFTEYNQARSYDEMRTHGVSGHLLYGTWNGMIHRCENPHHKYYYRYGGRGITVYGPWHDAGVFIADIENEIGPRPDGMTLDRINNDSNYEPGNVRWATKKEQRANCAKSGDYRKYTP